MRERSSGQRTGSAIEVETFKALLWLSAASALGACSSVQGNAELSREELMKPETCRDCHPKHYDQWASSMHAYASNDPVFVAMNKRGQREAKLGDFCVKCHAPMAVLEGATTDGTNLEQVPKYLKGVTCYFCHNAVHVSGDHNGKVRLANDTTMRGGIPDPVDPGVHVAAYSELHDRYRAESSSLCGGCHDVVTPKHDVHLERTFEEYRDTLFANVDAPTSQSCQACHMDPWQLNTVVAQVSGAKSGRNLHSHLWAAVDMPLSDFPNRDVLQAAIEQCELAGSIHSFDFRPHAGARGMFDLILETGAGHNQPSGAAQDRRMWLELTGYDQDGKVIDQSGKITDDSPEKNPKDSDIPLSSFNDRIFDAEGHEVHMFWDAAPSPAYPNGFESRGLPGPRSLTVGEHAVTIPLRLSAEIPGRVELRVRIRPVGFDVLQDLVDSGDLDADVLKQVPTFTVFSAVATWKKGAQSAADLSLAKTNAIDCNSYRCMLDPDLDECRSR